MQSDALIVLSASSIAPASLWTSSLRLVMHAPRMTMTTFSPKICTPITRNMPWMRATRTASRTTMPLRRLSEQSYSWSPAANAKAAMPTPSAATWASSEKHWWQKSRRRKTEFPLRKHKSPKFKMIFYPMEGDPSGFFDGAENAAFSFPSVNSCEIGRYSDGKLTI